MPVTEDFNPLTDPVPDEIPLTNAPLIRVVAQIRFPMIASIESREFIAPFQEALRKEYPILRQEQSHNLQLGEEGVQAATSRIWRFTDAAENWRVSLAPQFIAIEAKTYSSRGEFLSKLKSVLQHVEEHLDPGTVDRNGIRYIDRVEGEAPESFRPLIRSEVAGVLAAPFEDLTMQTLTQNTFKFPDHEGQLMARWGTMPPNSTPDPSAIEPIDRISWLLDLDAFSDQRRLWNTSQLLQETEWFAERIYAFFRWSVTDEFIRSFGGQIGEGEE